MKAKEFGMYLKNLRKENNLSIRQLAERSNVSNAYLSQVENGKRSVPSPEILKRLSEQLNTSYDELMNEAGYIETTNENPLQDKALEDLFNIIVNIGISEEQISNHLFGVGSNTKDTVMKHPYTNRNELIKALSDSGKSRMATSLISFLEAITHDRRNILMPFMDNGLSHDCSLLPNNIKQFTFILQPENLDLKGKAFVTKVTGNSVKNSRIQDKDMVLVKKQDSGFKSGDIVMAIYEGTIIFRRASFTNEDEIVLISDNIKESPILHSDNKCEIIGKIVQVFFTMN